MKEICDIGYLTEESPLCDGQVNRLGKVRLHTDMSRIGSSNPITLKGIKWVWKMDDGCMDNG